MREVFDNFDKQGRYILRLIKNHTDLDKKCQICGDKGKLKNNRLSPYEIQFVCAKCRNYLTINPITEMFNEISLINVKEHLTSKSLKSNMTTIDDIKNKINIILEGGYNKSTAIKYLGVSSTKYDSLINEYSKVIDKDIKDKLNSAYKKENDIRRRETKFKETRNDTYNNLSKIKQEKGITNRKIYALTNKKVTPSTISHIANGLITPKNTTMALLAESLETDIQSIFLEYKLYKNIRNINDLKVFMEKIYLNILFLYYDSEYKTFSRFLGNLAKNIDTTLPNLRKFILSTKDSDTLQLNSLNYNTISKIKDLYNKLDEVTFSFNKKEEVEEWKKKMKQN